MKTFFLASTGLAAFIGLMALALVPVSLSVATELATAAMLAALLLALVPGRAARFFFVTLCAWVVIRYLGWRIATLPLEGGLLADVGAVGLLGAEMYGGAMLLLGLFINAWPLERRIKPLPDDASKWPTVDIYIPTYSEPVNVVGPTLAAAVSIDYPMDKLNVYVLDDGYARSQNPATDPQQASELAQRSILLKALCARHGATWLSRENNLHAKSGNLNAAMEKTRGELIVVLDADHVPTRDFLTSTVGFFQDPKLAFVQTPHFFANPDPVERNLGLFNKMPSENDMFYRVVQKGLDLWNAAFFCGSAAVLRRTAILDAGGFSSESITEDASTSIKMHQKGWNSAYLAKPMVAGLQPETFAGFTVQRLRWAVGMMQILLKQNPLFVRGLAVAQRLSYLSVVMFWLFPFARMAFFLSPLISLFFNVTIYPLGLEYFVAYTAPYLLAVLLSFEKMFGRVRRIFISELYETLQSFYSIPALLGTLLRPNAPVFKVTPKGERLTQTFISQFNKPFYALYAVTVAGLLWGGWRLWSEPESRAALSLSVIWVFFNLTLLSGALGVLVERAQRRDRPRIAVNEKIKVQFREGGDEIDAVIVDISENGAQLLGDNLPKAGPCRIRMGQVWVDADLTTDGNTRNTGNRLAHFSKLTARQERAVIGCAYGNSDRWLEIWKKREASRNIVVSAVGVFHLAISKGNDHLRRLLHGSRDKPAKY